MSSFKEIIKSTGIIGGASSITVLINLVKTKILALWFGPLGIGYLGILTSVSTFFITIFSVGLSTIAVRELTQKKDSSKDFLSLYNSLKYLSLILGVCSVLFIIIFTPLISKSLLNSNESSYFVIFIAVATFFSIISIPRSALIQSLRKMNSIAKIKIASSFMSAFFGIIIVYYFGVESIAIFIALLSLSLFVFNYYFYRDDNLNQKVSSQEFYFLSKNLIKVGFFFMLASLLNVGNQVIVRFLIVNEFNINFAGYFQAAWQISMTYMSFILLAMATDYYPRLTESISDIKLSNKTVNEQAQISILLSIPIIILMLGFNFHIIQLLYSDAFYQSSEILKWQLFGDFIKIMTWPLGYILLAKGETRLFFYSELIWHLSYLILIFVFLPILGINITGYAFLISYLIMFLYVFYTVKNINNFKWSQENIFLIALSFFSIALVLITSYISSKLSIFVSIILAMVFIIKFLRLILSLDIKDRRILKLLRFVGLK